MITHATKNLFVQTAIVENVLEESLVKAKQT